MGIRRSVAISLSARADAIWAERSMPDADKKRSALYRIGKARDMESHSPYDSMKEYGIAARILELLEPRPKEYAEAVLSEKRLRDQIDAKIQEYVKAYRLATLADRYESAAAELRKISKLIPDSQDYRHQKAKLLYVRLMKQRSRGAGK